MPKSRKFPAEQPPIESDSEESETDSDSSDESDSEPEPKPAKKAPITPAPAIKKPLVGSVPVAKPTSSSSDSDSDAGSESETDSGSAPERINVIPSAAAKAPASTAKTPASTAKAPASTAKAPAPVKAPASAAKAPAVATAKAVKLPVPASPATGLKRPATPALVPDTDAKRSKRKAAAAAAAAENSAKKGASTEEGKKLFERVFTEEDEVVVLEELLKKYPNPKYPSEMDEFYNSVKSRVSVPVSKTQVQDKIRRLKNKYVKRASSNKKEKKEKKKKDGNNASEEEKRKEGLELMAFELSKRIWGKEEEKANGSEGTAAVALKLDEAKEDEGMEEDKKERNASSYARDGKSMEEWVFKEGTELLVGEEARDELEKEWKELRKEEAGILVKRFELLGKHAKMVYDALNSKKD